MDKNGYLLIMELLKLIVKVDKLLLMDKDRHMLNMELCRRGLVL